MSDRLRLVGLDNPKARGFADVLHKVTWLDEQPDLCVAMTAQNLGCLAVVRPPNFARADTHDEVTGVLTFSDHDPEADEIKVTTLLKGTEGRNAQDENVAKGLGELGGTIPWALARHYSQKNLAAVRVVPVHGLEDIYVGAGTDSPASLAARTLRHLWLWQNASLRDRSYQHRQRMAGLPDTDTPGTDEFVGKWGREYGGVAAALLPLSPVIKLYHVFHDIHPPHGIRAGHVLANGAASPALSPLRRIGTCAVPQRGRFKNTRIF